MTETLNSQRPNPCHNCPDRYIACGDHCRKPERLAWLEERRKIRENRKNYRAPAWISQESYVRRHK